MTKARILLSLAAVATVSACSWMPDVSMPDFSMPSVDSTASTRDNNLYGEERTASNAPRPEPAAAAPVVAPAVAPTPAPAAEPAPALTPMPEPTPAPVTSAEPMVQKSVTK